VAGLIRLHDTFEADVFRDLIDPANVPKEFGGKTLGGMSGKDIAEKVQGSGDYFRALKDSGKK
jgi:hypothetical protein